MKTRAATLHGVNQPFLIEELDLDEPKEHEVLVHLAATGLCHSDWHFVTGDIPCPFPVVAGHEGAGVVERVGPNVTQVAPGDHVVLSFIPACGVCRWCTQGMANLCDLGAGMLSGRQLDGTYRLHKAGVPYRQSGRISTFSEWTVVPEISCVKIARDLPLDRACLTGCGVATGFGAAVHRAQVTAGSTVVVIGCGGIGMNAIQGAALCGAARVIAVDVVDFKLEQARKFGATHTINSRREDVTQRVLELTEGVGADYTLEAIGTPVTLGQAFDCARKGGTTVAIGVSPSTTERIPINPFNLVLFQKALLGTVYGSGAPRREIPRLLDLYRAGRLKLDELITRTYRLEQINEGYADMLAGKNVRGVIRYEWADAL